jgi:hypothetical protein
VSRKRTFHVLVQLDTSCANGKAILSIGLGIVVPRRSWRDIFCGKLGIGTKKEKSSKKKRNGGPVGTDAADGNPLPTRIPTAAWKAQNAFHNSHKARRRFHNTNRIQQQKKGTFLAR